MDKTFLKRQGANFLTLINDLKRNRKAAAEELGIPLTRLEKIISGEADLPPEVVERATQIWPVNRRDFMILEDDAPDGVFLMRREQSKTTSRVFARGGFDYYEYRDTAMSKIATFRPEWILELCTVEDDIPDNSRLQWNNGHFMHQFTMFINAVNFYYLEDNKRKVMTAHTGDSMYITPFVPHTFATRRKDSEKRYGGKKGLILALTYGNRLVGDAQHELSALGNMLPYQYLLDTSSREKYFSSLLKQQMEGLTFSKENLLELTSLDEKRVTQWLEGTALPMTEEYGALADLFHINSRDLIPPDQFDPRVIIRYLNDVTPRRFENYTITELAAVRYLPYSKSLILQAELPARTLNLMVPLHQYCYNFGSQPVLLRWQSNGAQKEEILQSDDSIYLKPFIPHSFSPVGNGKAQLLSLRIGGRICGEAQRELSHVGRQNLRRVYEEHTLWYREE